MNKIRIKIADTQFAHGQSFGTGDLNIPPVSFDWYRGNENINDVVVVTESWFEFADQFSEKIKIALIIEPKSINANSYLWIVQNHHKFKYVLTHNEELIATDPKKFIFYPFGGCWIEPSQRRVYEKTKNISIISSHKTQAIGHQLRHEIIKKYGHLIDGVYGRGYTPVENKITALKDYRYSIVIENEKSDTWFTEKLIDCFATGTIPIYWGTDKVINHFYGSGLIMLSNRIDHIGNVLAEIQTDGHAEKWYKERLAGVNKNLSLLEVYAIPEDWLYRNFFNKYDLV